jgi:hypothetical protein
MIPRVINSITPMPAPRPPLWFPVIALAIAVAPTFGIFLWMFWS